MGEQRLFISHASEDAAVAEAIVAYLEANGVPCWIASRDIPPRAIYADAIVEGMQGASACAVLVSTASNASKAVKREVELASHEDKAFIPISIDGSEPTSGLAYYLRNTQWIDYCAGKERALQRICDSIIAVAGTWTGTIEWDKGWTHVWRFDRDGGWVWESGTDKAKPISRGTWTRRVSDVEIRCDGDSSPRGFVVQIRGDARSGSALWSSGKQGVVLFNRVVSP